jgi:hypothetical protein
VTQPPAGSNRYTIVETRGYSVRGVSGISGARWATDSNTDEEVIDL